MKRTVAWIFLILIVINLHGQNQVNGKDIVNKLTKNHIRIPGTHLYFIAPKDFEIGKTFIGITNNKNINILVMDVFGSDFRIQSKEFNKSTFEATGLTIYDYKEFKINGNNAKCLYTNSLNSKDKNLMLAFGDSTFTVLLTATFNAGAEKSLKKIEKCLLSVLYDKTVTIDPFETARFELDLSNSDYKFDKGTSGVFSYTMHHTDSLNENTPFFIVTQMPYQDATDEILKITTKQMIDKAKEYGTNDLVLNFKKLEINGCKAIETTGFGKSDEKKILYYLLVVGKPKNVTVINSLIHADFENNLKKLTDVTHSIILK
jgi:hypothetical protein